MKSIPLAILIAAALPSIASAALIPINLPGTTSVSSWGNMTAANFPGYPGYTTSGNPWPAPIAATGAAMDLNKTAGLGFPSNGGGLYVGGLASGTGNFSVVSAVSLANLETVVFQIQISGIGADWANVIPALSLNYNGGVQALPWDFSKVGAVAGPIMFGQPSFDYTVALQWDLTGIVDPISSFEIGWTAAEHSLAPAIEVVQGDTMVQVVPEASTAGLVLAGGIACLLRRRRAPIKQGAE